MGMTEQERMGRHFGDKLESGWKPNSVVESALRRGVVTAQGLLVDYLVRLELYELGRRTRDGSRLSEQADQEIKADIPRVRSSQE